MLDKALTMVVSRRSDGFIVRRDWVGKSRSRLPS